MKLPGAEWQRGAPMRRLMKVLGAEEGKTRYVGGCVRDTLLKLPVSDVDLATRLRPEDVIERLGEAGIKVVPTGLAHGTVTAVVAGSPVEVTSLRRDVSTDGRRATIAYTGDWREDAGRRDFTINALTADPRTAEIFDYFDGLADIEARRVRFIGDPMTRIAEDHLRILRFFRFHARFGAGEPDADALSACAERANDLMALSRERIADELLKLLALPDPVPALRLMVENGIFKPVLPEIDTVERLEQLARNEAGFAPEPLRRLAALLPRDPEIAASVAARLRLSNKAAKRLVSAADPSLDSPKLLAYRIGIAEAIDRLLLSGADKAGIGSLQDWRKPQFPLGGGDLIAMGLVPGPLVARTLQQVERLWAEGGFEGDRKALIALARREVDQALRSSQ